MVRRSQHLYKLRSRNRLTCRSLEITMDRSCCSLFLQTCLILLLRVEFSSSDDFDVTTIYNLQKILDRTSIIQDYSSDLPTMNKISSVEIHARNNARGLPFISQAGDMFDSNLAVDIKPCSFFNDDCNWTLSDFTLIFLNSPLNLPGNTEKYTTITTGRKPQIRPFYKEFSFIFNTTHSSGALNIYLLDSHEGLSEANMYYFTVRNRYNGYSQFYRCTKNYMYPTFITIAPGYPDRKCKLISQSTIFRSSWERQNYKFSVNIEQRQISVTVKTNGNTETLFSWTDNDVLNIQYYTIGTSHMTGSFTPNEGADYERSAVLTEANGSIVSEAFIPRYNEVCVSVVYFKAQSGSVELKIIKDNGEKYHFSCLQTTSLDDGWLSSIYNVQLPEEKTYSPMKIEVSAGAPVENRHNIAIQRITGCNSEGLNEDIYIESSNKTMTEADLYAYDVAVKRSASDFEEEPECLNGGLFDEGRSSCICPAGFTGKTCELGCGPDRYDSKCSGRCSKTQRGCMEMKLCRPKLGCNCAPGLKGVLCDITCHGGEYGASCKQKCGNCVHGTCDIYTGHCPLGCEAGFYPPFCKTRYKHLNIPPKVVSIGYHTLQVTFSMKPEDVAGTGTPTFYQFQIKDGGNQVNTWSEMKPILLPGTQNVKSNITQLNPGTKYTIRVVLLDLDGNSYQGKDVPTTIAFTQCIVPTVDYNLTAVTIGQNEFQVKWELEAVNSLWCKLVHFEVGLNADWKWKLYYARNEKTFTFSDLLPGEKYKVHVRGFSVDGPLAFSDPLIVTTQDEAPQTVYDPRIVSRTYSQIEISWKEPFSPRGKIEKYKVMYKTGNSGFYIAARVEADDTNTYNSSSINNNRVTADDGFIALECQKLLDCSEEDCSNFAGHFEVRKPSVTLLGLVPHAQYLISIAAKSALYGSEVQILATTDMAVPGVSPSPGVPTVVARTNSTLTVQWKQPENCTYVNGYLYGYQYECFEPKNPRPMYEGSTQNTSATFVGLQPHTVYEVKVYLKTSGGLSYSHPLIINATTRATVPGKVEELTLYKKGRRILGLRWALPKETYGDIKSFTISYSNDHQKRTSFIVKPTTCIAWPEFYCHTIDSLHGDTEYTITVQARNKEVSEDGEIAQLVATTKENAPLAPNYIKTVSQTETSLTIEWGLPKLINGVLRSFLVNVEETDSVNITDCCQYFPIQEIAVQYEQASYQIKLNNLKPASSYAISITAKTVALGPAVSITAHTRPPVPSLNGILEIVNSSEMKISSNPAININTTSINEDLLVGFLLVVIPKSANVSVEETPVSNEWLTQELEKQINGTFYIAAEVNKDDLENDPAEVVLGKHTELQNGKWSLLWDPVLKDGKQYCIGLVALLDYCGIFNIGYIETDILTVNH